MGEQARAKSWDRLHKQLQPPPVQPAGPSVAGLTIELGVITLMVRSIADIARSEASASRHLRPSSPAWRSSPWEGAVRATMKQSAYFSSGYACAGGVRRRSTGEGARRRRAPAILRLIPTRRRFGGNVRGGRTGRARIGAAGGR
jgi:hypothetical protein